MVTRRRGGARVRARLAAAAVVLGAFGAPRSASAGVQALDGSAVAWATVPAADRGTVVVFTTLWCEICRREEPAVRDWAAANAARAATVIVVSGSPAAKVAAAAPGRQWGAPLRVLVDEGGDLARAFEVDATPTLVVLHPGGDTAARFHRIAEVTLAGAEGAGGRTHTDTGQELGTTYDVTVVSDRDAETVRRDLAAARELCRDLERQLSEWREDSEISRVNREAAAAPVPVSEPLRRIVTGALQVTAITGGAFDLTWKTLEPVWARAEKRDAPPTDGELEDARSAMGPGNVTLEAGSLRLGSPSTRLGIAGVAKGWIIDAVFLNLRRAGYDDVLVNIGGDLRAAGAAEDGTPHRIEIADPYRPGVSAGSLEVADTAIATSGNYLRTRRIAGRDIGHILDPRTGWPPDFDGSVTVLAPDAAMADALATALFVLGPDAGLALVRDLEGVEAVYATRDGLRSSMAAP